MAQKVKNNWLQKLKQQIKKTAHLNGSHRQSQTQSDDEVREQSLKEIARSAMAKKIQDRRAVNLPPNYYMIW